MVGHVFSVDFNGMTLSVEWEMAGCGVGYLADTDWKIPGYLPMQCGRIQVPLEIYFGDAVRPAWKWDSEGGPRFDHGNGSFTTDLCVPLQFLKSSYEPISCRSTNLRRFRTQHPIVVKNWKKRMVKDQWFNLDFTYPYTAYSTDSFSFVAVTLPSSSGLAQGQTAVSKTASPTNLTFHPFLDAAIVDARDMLIPIDSNGAPRGGMFAFTTNVETDGVENASLTRTTTVEIPGNSRYMMILGVRYSALAQVFTIILFVTNWSLTISLAYITLIIYHGE